MKNLEIKITNENNGMVTKAFAKRAIIFGTPEYKAWKEFLNEYPNAKMVTKTIKKNPEKKSFLNLTYENMKGYIAEQENAEELIKEFEKQLALSKIQTSPYRFVVAWFEQKFENYDSYKQYFENLKKQAEAKAKLKIVNTNDEQEISA